MYVIKSNRKTNSYIVRKINRTTQVVRVGRRGLQGETGPQGPKGDQGDPATNLVQSVNGKQGVVVLNATGVGADPVGSASQALQDAKDYTDTEVSTLDSSLATVAKTEAQVQDVQDNLDAHEADTANPHSVTKSQVGLGNVANLAPADMPVSTAQQTVLNGKADRLSIAQFSVPYRTAGTGEANSSIPVAQGSAGADTLARRTATGATFTGVPTDASHATTKAYVDAADALKLNISDNRVELRGVGFPQGVVSAPVGSTYIDTNATNGAIEWKKATGSSTTGWVVSVGDTGWRDITSLAPVGNIVQGTFSLRRINNTVYARGVNLETNAVNAVLLANFNLIGGDGFKPVENSDFIVILNGDRTVRWSYNVQPASTTGAIVRRGEATRSYQATDWTTVNPWPITLP